jgi:CBS-domain-containing membrane protein
MEALLEREGKGSTYLGNGVGYPHIRCEHFTDFLLAIATFPEGVPYDGPASEPARLILLAIVPPAKNALLLGVVACLSHIVEDAKLLEELVAAGDADDVLEAIRRTGLEVRETVTAGDIMKRCPVSVPAEMGLSEVAALMHREHVDVLPVVAEDNRLLGQVSAQHLFEACLPPYFRNLPSMRFVREIDPFERFVREKAHVPVREVIDESAQAVTEDTSLAELLARLSRVGVSTIYVVEADRLVGVIDNFSIIDKILAL